MPPPGAADARPDQEASRPVAALVGRDAELEACLRWLGGDTAGNPLLAVFGGPGTGKTAMLRAFAHLARTEGWILSTGDPDQPGGLRLPTGRALLVADPGAAWLPAAWEEAVAAALAAGARVVIACRRLPQEPPASWAGIAWPPPMLRTGALSLDAARALLARHGVTGERADAIAQATAHHPGAMLSAVTPLAGERTHSPLAIHGWAGRMLGDAPDDATRAGLELASLVRELDEGLLAELLGADAGRRSFDGLCTLSTCLPASGGLVAEAAARRLIAGDLRWRNPERRAALRAGAATHYAGLARAATPDRRAAYVADTLFLCEDPAVHAMVFADEEPDAVQAVRVPAAGPVDREALVDLWCAWVRSSFALQTVAPIEVEELRGILAYRGIRLTVARRRAGGALAGFSAVVPVCRESVDLLRHSAVAATLIEACWSRPELAGLAATPEASRAFFLHHLAIAGDLPGAARGCLLRDALGELALGGVYFASVASEPLQRLVQALGFRPVPAARNADLDPAHPVEGYVLDLSRVGFQRYAETLVAGWPGLAAGHLALDPDRVEQALEDALAHWDDAAWLAASSLAAYLGLSPGQPPAVASALRDTVRSTLEALLQDAPPGGRAVWRALQMGYLQRTTSHERAGREIGVSRSTFYRLLRRGIRELAAALPVGVHRTEGRGNPGRE